MSTQLQLLKLGGSLITEKSQPHTARPELIQRLAVEIQRARQRVLDSAKGAGKTEVGLSLVVGHGSGSFGHVPAAQHSTRQGVHSAQDWQGFIEVWREAAALHHMVIDALGAAGVPALSFPPSASITVADGEIIDWNLSPLNAALQAGLVPVVYGDVVFDRLRGGTILSTEDLFSYLARQLKPQRILLAGIEPGVWADYPECTRLVPEITPHNLESLKVILQGSAATDVTGGMYSKVQESLEIVLNTPGLEISIFSAWQSGELERALLGERVGTRIHAG